MKFAVIKTGGKQYKVTEGQKIKIEKLDAKEGDNFIFEEVLLLNDGKEIKIGQPYIEGAKVEVKVLKQDKADKVIIFKFKSKKRYQVKRGHRQPYSQVEIIKIGV